MQLAGDLDRVRDRADGIVRGGNARIGNRASVLALDLSRARGRFLGAVEDVHRGRLENRTEPRVAPVAGRLADAAARLLPTGERIRYAEEFRSELWEIARTRGCRRAQLAYAARQLLAGRRLRAELRVPRRRGAVS